MATTDGPCCACGGRGWVRVSSRGDAWPIACSSCTTTLRDRAQTIDADPRTLRRLLDYKRGALSIKYTTASRLFNALCKHAPAVVRG